MSGPTDTPIPSPAGPYFDPTSPLALELAAIVHVTRTATFLPLSIRYRICFDSMAAIRALRDNRIPEYPHDDLYGNLPLLSSASVTVGWLPGHSGIIGNQLAYHLAREITSRAPVIP